MARACPTPPPPPLPPPPRPPPAPSAQGPRLDPPALAFRVLRRAGGGRPAARLLSGARLRLALLPLPRRRGLPAGDPPQHPPGRPAGIAPRPGPGGTGLCLAP